MNSVTQGLLSLLCVTIPGTSFRSWECAIPLLCYFKLGPPSFRLPTSLPPLGLFSKRPPAARIPAGVIKGPPIPLFASSFFGAFFFLFFANVSFIPLTESQTQGSERPRGLTLLNHPMLCFKIILFSRALCSIHHLRFAFFLAYFNKCFQTKTLYGLQKMLALLDCRQARMPHVEHWRPSEFDRIFKSILSLPAAQGDKRNPSLVVRNFSVCLREVPTLVGSSVGGTKVLLHPPTPPD